MTDQLTQACDAPRFSSPSPLFAVLGVLSDESSSFRNAVRQSWLHDTGRADVVTRLVLRGIGASQLVRREARAFADTVFVHLDAAATRVSVLPTVLLWYQCATAAWPTARLIGRASDEQWLHLPDIFASLSWLDAAFAARGVPHLLWAPEVSTREAWNATALAVVPSEAAWGATRGQVSCESRKGDVHGPFPVARGGVVFLSAALASRVALDPQLEPHRAAALAAAAAAAAAAHRLDSDAWLGFALSMLRPPPPLAVAAMARELSFELWGFYMTRAAVVWRAKHKVAGRLSALQQWAEAEHCARPRRPPPTVRPRGPKLTPVGHVNDCAENKLKSGVSCGGGRWWHCLDQNLGRCANARALGAHTSWRRLTRSDSA